MTTVPSQRGSTKEPVDDDDGLLMQNIQRREGAHARKH